MKHTRGYVVKGKHLLVLGILRKHTRQCNEREEIYIAADFHYTLCVSSARSTRDTHGCKSLARLKRGSIYGLRRSQDLKTLVCRLAYDKRTYRDR